MVAARPWPKHQRYLEWPLRVSTVLSDQLERRGADMLAYLVLAETIPRWMNGLVAMVCPRNRVASSGPHKDTPSQHGRRDGSYISAWAKIARWIHPKAQYGRSEVGHAADTTSRS